VIIVNLLVLVLYHSHHYSAIIYWISSAYCDEQRFTKFRYRKLLI